MPKTPEQLIRQRERAAARKAAAAGGTAPVKQSRATPPITTSPADSPLIVRVPHPESATASKRYSLDMLEELEILIDQKPNWLPGDNHDLAVITYALNRALHAADRMMKRHADDSCWKDRRKRNYWRPPVSILTS